MFWSWVKGLVAAPPANARSAPAGQPAERVPATTASAREPAWPNLPPVQRALDRPLEPAAPLDSFTGSLAAHQNPSFLAPLGHLVDPSGSGGLVNGLAIAAPGVAATYAGNAQLSVPAAAKRVTTVQRQQAGWAADVSVETPPGETQLVETLTSKALTGEIQTGKTSEPHGKVTDDHRSAQPLRTSASSTAPVAIQRTLAVVDDPDPRRATLPAMVDRELPVVTQPPQLQRTDSAAISPAIEEAPPLSPPEEAPPAGTVEPSAPLSGFSAAISPLKDQPPVQPGDSATPPTQVARPAREVQQLRVQRLASGPTRPDPPTTIFASESGAAAGTDHAESSGRPEPRVPEPPALAQPEPSNDKAQFDSSTETVQLEASTDSVAVDPPTSAHPLPSAVARPTVAMSRPGLAASVPLQRLPEMPAVHSAPRRTPPQHESQPYPKRAGSDVTPRAVPAVQALHSPDAAVRPGQAEASFGTAPADETDGSMTPIVSAWSADPSLADFNKPKAATMPVITQRPMSAQPAEPAHTVGLLADRPPLFPVPKRLRQERVFTPVQRITHLPAIESQADSGPTVSRPAGIPRSLSPAPDLAHPVVQTAAAQPISLQRVLPTVASPDGDSRHPSPPDRGSPSLGTPASSTPLIRQPLARHERPIHAVGPAVSFATMFSPTAAEDHGAGADGFTSVQLQDANAERGVSLPTEAGTPASPPDAAAATTSITSSEAIPPISPVGNADEPTGDLDEMARKLFEPLSARLRAELWLDRERAGLIADVRR